MKVVVFSKYFKPYVFIYSYIHFPSTSPGVTGGVILILASGETSLLLSSVFTWFKSLSDSEGVGAEMLGLGDIGVGGDG